MPCLWRRRMRQAGDQLVSAVLLWSWWQALQSAFEQLYQEQQRLAYECHALRCGAQGESLVSYRARLSRHATYWQEQRLITCLQAAC